MKPVNLRPILVALERASEDRHQLAADLARHTQTDTERFDAVAQTLNAIHTDVKSLLSTRAFQRGAFWMLGIIGGAAGVIASIVIDFFRRPH